MNRPCCLILISLLLGACSSQQAGEVGTALSERYMAPQDYAEHRAQQQFFDSADGRLAYTDHGDGEVIVLLHGVPTSSWMYRKVIPGLSAQLRVISVDLLGFGSSSKPRDNGNVYRAERRAARVQALLNHLGVRRYSLVMHDMGGLVAWELLRNNLEAVANLVVLNTIITEDGFNHPNFRPGVFSRQLTRAYANKLTSAAVLKLSFDNLGLGGDYKLSEAECYGYVHPMREGADQALYAFFTHLDDELFARLASNQDVLSQFGGQTLVLWGDLDDVLTSKQLRFLEQHLKNPPQTTIYPDHKHFLAEEIPDVVVSKVLQFMDRYK